MKYVSTKTVEKKPVGGEGQIRRKMFLLLLSHSHKILKNIFLGFDHQYLENVNK